MTETRVYEPTRLSTPPEALFPLKPLDANLDEVIVMLGPPFRTRRKQGGVNIREDVWDKKKQLANS